MVTALDTQAHFHDVKRWISLIGGVGLGGLVTAISALAFVCIDQMTVDQTTAFGIGLGVGLASMAAGGVGFWAHNRRMKRIRAQIFNEAKVDFTPNHELPPKAYHYLGGEPRA